MKKQIYIAAIFLLFIITCLSACTGNNANGKRDTTTTLGGDVSNKDTLLDREKPADTDKMDTGKEKANMRKK
jgi:hypothetical protein